MPVTVTTTLGKQRQIITLKAEEGVTKEAVRATLRVTAAEQLAQEERLGNKGARVLVDGRDGKSLLQAERKVTILFPAAAMEVALGAVRGALQRAIASTTRRRTGSLEDDWIFVHFQRDDTGRVIAQRVITGGGSVMLGPRDSVMLIPSGANAEYAAFVNRLVKGGGKLGRNVRSRKTKQLTRHSMGFMGAAVRSVRNHPAMAAVHVRVLNSYRYAPPKASRKQGVPTILIRPRRFRTG